MAVCYCPPGRSDCAVCRERRAKKAAAEAARQKEEENAWAWEMQKAATYARRDGKYRIPSDDDAAQ